MRKLIFALLMVFHFSLILNAQDAESEEKDTLTVFSIHDTLKNNRVINLNRQVIENIPNIERRFGDFLKLVPYSKGQSFMGYNPQFNRYTLNGLALNNAFGFDGVLLGDQANSQLISVNVIENINVDASPFDVSKSGFLGANVEMNTISGGDQLQANGYLFYNNQSLTGSKVRGEEYDLVNNSFFQGGVTVSGPIIENKLFYAFNAEFEEYTIPGSDLVVNRDGDIAPNENRARLSDMIFLRDLFSQTYGYNLGEFERFGRNRNSEKVFLKLDWLINPEHRLQLTYNFFDGYSENNASSDILGFRGPDKSIMQFSNSGHSSKSQIHSAVLQLDSKWSENVSNQFTAGFSSSIDTRDPFSSPMPAVMIKRLEYPYIYAGHDPLSANYTLDQTNFQLGNDFTYKTGDHFLSAGVSFERFNADASFNFDAYEAFDLNYPGGTFGNGFNSLVEFVNYFTSGNLDAVIARSRQAFTQNTLNNTWDRSESSIGQASFYIQDDFEVSDRLSLKLGLRLEQPLYFDTEDKINEAIARKGGVLDVGNPDGNYAHDLIYFNELGEEISLSSTSLPETPMLIAPRFSFEYKSSWLNDMIITGGSGIFNGRIPGTWLNHQVDNTDYFNYMVLGPEFRIPQVWRSNLNAAVSVFGLHITADVTYSTDINSPIVKNYGLNLPSTALSGVDFREIFNPATDFALDPNGNPGQDAYVLTSESKGSSLNTFVTIEKKWPLGIITSAAYNYLESENISSMESPVISDNFFRRGVVDNPNITQLGPSRYANQHRFWVNVTKAFAYDQWETRITLFNEIQRGGGFSYTYAGDANGDGIPHNDLVYIPTGSELSNFNFIGSSPVQEAQRLSMNNFINQDPYLSSRRGEYASAYAGYTPWNWRMDLRVVQCLKWKEQRLDFSIDILNFSNLLSSSWGLVQNTYNNQPFGVTVDPATREPTYFFDVNQDRSFQDDFGLSSRWRLRVGLSYYLK